MLFCYNYKCQPLGKILIEIIITSKHKNLPKTDSIIIQIKIPRIPEIPRKSLIAQGRSFFICKSNPT